MSLNELQYNLLLEGWMTIDKTLFSFKSVEDLFILVFMSTIQFWHKNSHAVSINQILLDTYLFIIF